MSNENGFNLEETKKFPEQLKQDRFISTGYECWDELCGGLKKSGLTLLAARPAMGKTSLVLNIVSHIARQQTGTILVFSPCIQDRDVTIRLLSIGTGLPARKLLDGSISAAELANKYAEFFHAQKSNIKIETLTMPSIENIAHYSRNTLDLQLLVVNHIERVCKPFELWDNALPWDKNSEPRDKTLQALNGLAQELQVPILCTTHLHRSLERRKNKRPRLEDLWKTGISAEWVDQIVFLHRDRYYDPFGKDGTECMIVKSSYGNAGVVELDWDHTTGRFL